MESASEDTSAGDGVGDDGTEIAHGHNEELIMLQFLDEGRRVRLAAVTARLPRQLADAIATAWLGEHCQYVEDLSPAHPAAVRRMVTALLGREVDQVRLVELAVRNAPLAGAPELVLRAPDGDRDIAEAVGQFEATAGPLLDRLDDVLYVKVAYGDRRVVLDFLGKGGAPVVRFSDGRMPKRDAQAFRKLVATQFGVPVHPGETACA